ncbi:MAG TPA: NrfD/PsrC family molybdoenzyme membrane anchor subunit [Myxococcaceae bacterium]|nr:NrfD/PsrC family molybdoenzyme membrane anchor subunit [Myxococcaceae bacterium]
MSARRLPGEARGDGRNIDPELGTLGGEGAQQRGSDVDTPLSARVGAQSEPRSYYGQPVLKAPVWIDSIPVYFYVGGTAGAASVLGAAADLAGGRRFAPLVRWCHLLGVAGDALSGALLVHDLGRPERFLNMLRTFRVRSPMSMGSWILAASGALNTVAMLLAHRRDGVGVLGRLASAGAGPLGAALSGYTAVLLNNTANPIWKHTHHTLPILFMSSSVASAGAILEQLPLDERSRRVARVYGIAGAAASLVSSVAVEREAARSAPVARPLQEGASGALWMASRVCTAAGLTLSLLWRRRSWASTASSVLISAGALAMRFAIFKAGQASARDPHATFRPQREGLSAPLARDSARVPRAAASR